MAGVHSSSILKRWKEANKKITELQFDLILLKKLLSLIHLERGVVFNLRTEKGRCSKMMKGMPMLLPDGLCVH